MKRGNMIGTLLLAGLGGIAAKAVLDKRSDDENVEIDLDGFFRESYKETQKQCKETLRRHLGNQIVFTGLTSDAVRRELDEDELLDGEESAFITQIGCYSVRSAKLHGTDPEDGTKSCINEISARHSSADNHGFLAAYNHIYSIQEDSSANWTEEVLFIGTVKKGVFLPNDQAELFIMIRYTGSSFSADTWYKMTPDGVVTGYQEHPYDSDSYNKSWET